MNEMDPEFPWATFTFIALTFSAALIGAGVVIWGDPGSLSFSNYIKYMGEYAIAAGLLGIGRGIRASAKYTSQSR